MAKEIEETEEQKAAAITQQKAEAEAASKAKLQSGTATDSVNILGLIMKTTKAEAEAAIKKIEKGLMVAVNHLHRNGQVIQKNSVIPAGLEMTTKEVQSLLERKLIKDK